MMIESDRRRKLLSRAAPSAKRQSPPKARQKALDHEVQDAIPVAAVGRASPERLQKARDLAAACARIAHDNRAKDIVLLDLKDINPLIDFFVIATVAARRQASAIASEIDQEMKKRGERKLGAEGVEEGRWVLIDYGDFVVHVFSEEARQYYALEDIWGDAPRIELALP